MSGLHLMGVEMVDSDSPDALSAAVVLRAAQPGDERFIRDSWKRSYTRIDPQSREWHRGMDSRIDLVLTHPRSRILVAASPLSNRHILGWLAHAETEPPVIHWAYVKHGYRSKPEQPVGLLWLLLGTIGIDRDSELFYTFQHPRARRLAAKFKRAEYLPAEEFAK